MSGMPGSLGLILLSSDVSCLSTFLNVSYLSPRHYLSKTGLATEIIHILIIIDFLTKNKYVPLHCTTTDSRERLGDFTTTALLPQRRQEGGREKERNITFVNISHISQYQIKILTLKSVINFFLINCNFFLHRIIRPQKKDNGEHHQIHETLDQDSVRICNKERTCSKEGQDYLE